MDAVDSIRRWGEERDWRGYDPYDALNSPLAPYLTLGTSFGRRALTQAVKRSPVNLRPLLRIRPALERRRPWRSWRRATRGSAAARRDETAAAQGRRWLDWLVAARRADGRRARLGLPLRRPDAVLRLRRGYAEHDRDSFAAHALLDGRRAPRTSRAVRRRGRAVAHGSSSSSMLDEERPLPYFRYLRGRARARAQREPPRLLGRRSLGHGLSGRRCRRAPAGGRRRRASTAQRSDGVVAVRGRPAGGWVDNFHTGYVLESLGECERLDATVRSGARARVRLLGAGALPGRRDAEAHPDEHASHRCAQLRAGDRDVAVGGGVARRRRRASATRCARAPDRADARTRRATSTSSSGGSGRAACRSSAGRPHRRFGRSRDSSWHSPELAMRVWIDLANSPHVPLFEPVVAAARDAGRRGASSPRATTRRRCRSPRRSGRRSWSIGGASPAGRAAKGRAIVGSGGGAAPVCAAGTRPTSRSRTARTRRSSPRGLARVPAVTMMDYEHQPANHLSFRLARRVIVPEAFPEAACGGSARGARPFATTASRRSCTSRARRRITRMLTGARARPRARHGRRCARRRKGRSTTAAATRGSTTCSSTSSSEGAQVVLLPAHGGAGDALPPGRGRRSRTRPVDGATLLATVDSRSAQAAR